MSRIVNDDFVKLFENYPFYSQENEKDPLIVAKLFDAYGSGTWYLTEYNPEDRLAFGYVAGLFEDEWGYVSVEELEAVKHSALGVPRIERDLYFTQAKFSEVVC